MVISIKTYMMAYLAALLVISAIMLGQWARLLVGVGMVVVYVAADLLWTYLKSKSWYWPDSSVISALILALVFDTATHPYLALASPLVAVVGKHLLHFGRIRHLMNPAAFAMVLLSFFVPVVAWWGPSWGNVPATIVIFSGLYILYRTRRFPIAIAFFATYIILLLVMNGLRGGGWSSTGMIVGALLFDGTVLFFTTVMLIEPVTTSWPRPRHRLAAGFAVAALAALFSLLPRLGPLRTMDPLLFSLVIVTMVMGLKLVPKSLPHPS